MHITKTHEVEARNPVDAIFADRTLGNGFLHFRANSWLTEKKISEVGLFDDISALSTRRDESGYESVLLEWGDAIVWLANNQGNLTVNVAADTIENMDDAFARIQEFLPAITGDEEVKSTIINFWSQTAHGPANFRRRIAIPRWDEIESNYTRNVRDDLSLLMSYDNGRWSENGQLLLWQGDPGTGKTYALRALAASWRDWCDFHYITDPERFFGSESNYLLSVLLSGSSPVEQVTDYYDDYAPAAPKADAPKWKLLILEDSGELLTADAKTVVGQALSRLLNTVDGLIGQGLRIIVLVTTNEEIGRLHPAVSRHGRCASKIEFTRLKADEVSKWLEEHESDAPVKGSYSVAELYGLLSGKEETGKVALGFS